ncbi:SDR family oxidoreductase, partial [Streptomyces sp. MBT70]|nr:SDR family oxidoreductase [Streptomyces sp. MBT70]
MDPPALRKRPLTRRTRSAARPAADPRLRTDRLPGLGPAADGPGRLLALRRAHRQGGLGAGPVAHHRPGGETGAGRCPVRVRGHRRLRPAHPLLAAEYASHGIRVNAVAPGFVVTLLARGVLDDPAAAGAVLTRVPMGRLELPPGGRLGHRVPVWPRSGLRQQSGDPRRRRLLGSLRPALRPVRARAVP